MKKLTDKEIRRLLSARGTLEPPEGLADRIKAEIPEVLQVGGTGLEPENGRMMPPRSAGLRPFWLIAASLLVFIGAGFMVVRLFGPSENLARRIALDGVTVIKDVVVTVPERSSVEMQKPASAMTVAKSTTKGERRAAPPNARAAAKVESATIGEVQPPIEAETGETSATVVGGTTEQMAVVMRQNRAADEIAIAGHPATSRLGRPAALADKMEPVAAPLQTASGSVIVVVQDAAGRPIVGASVRLDLPDRPDVNCGSRETGVNGATSFCCVAPGTYRVCVQLQGFVAASAKVVVTSAGQVTLPLTIERQPANGKEHSWACATPAPPATR